MVRINEHEKKFFEDLKAPPAPVAPPSPHPELHQPGPGSAIKPFRAARSLVKTIQDPHKGIARLIVGTATSNLAFKKEGGVGAIGIYRILNDRWGEKWHDWEPETIWAMLNIEEGIETTDEIRNIIMALQVVCRTNQPFENWHVFENVGQAFNLNPVDFGSVQPLELTEVALTLKILKAIRPNQEFESEVDGYIAACAKHAGVVYLPKEVFSDQDCQRIVLDISEGGKDVYEELKAGKKDSPEAKIQLLKLKEIEDYIEANWEA